MIYLIDNLTFVIAFKRNKEIRTEVFNFEKELKEFFPTPFRVIAVPDNEDPNIPRFEGSYKNSNLAVSQVRLDYQTLFERELDNHKVKEIVNKRINVFKRLVPEDRIDFIAYIVEIVYPFDKDTDIIESFRNYTKATPLKEETVEFTIFYAVPFKENYFLNIKCSKINDIVQQIEINPALLKGTIKEQTFIKGIRVTIDLNTKKYFNQYKSFNPGLYNPIEDELFRIINTNKIENYLTGEIK